MLDFISVEGSKTGENGFNCRTRETGLPLFFQGTDFANTAIENAMVLLGYGMSEKGVAQPMRPGQE